MRTISELQTAPSDLPDNAVQTLVCVKDVIARFGLGVLLNQQKWVSRCLLACEHEEAVALTRRHKPDVAIVKLCRSSRPFLASQLAELRAAHPAMSILISSSWTQNSLLSPFGVGVLPTRYRAEEVITMVRAALVGAELPRTREEQPELDLLSEREREVLALLSTGATNREIAAIMHVGTETVKKHAGALYRKLGVRNRTEAAQRAAQLLVA